MNDFVAYTSRGRVILFLAALVPFALYGLYMGGAFGAPEESRRLSPSMMFGVGWSAVILCLIHAVIFIKMLFEQGEQLRIGSSGIFLRAWSDDTIPWSEITDAKPFNYRGNRIIVLYLRDPGLFPARGLRAKFSWTETRPGGCDIWLSLIATDRSFAEAMTAIDRFCPRKTATAI